MENYENQTPQQPAAKKGITETVKGFTQKLDLEAKSQKLMDTSVGLWNKFISLPVKLLIGIGSGVAALIVAIIVLVALSNTTRTPLDNMVKILNTKKFDKVLTQAPDIMNGFCETELRNIIKIMKKSDVYKENKDEIAEFWEERFVGTLKEEYGDNYKISYKITGKEKLDKDDCKDIQKNMREAGKSLVNAAKEAGKADSDEWEEAEEQLGLKKKEIKSLLKEFESMGKKMKSAKVTAGYELDVTLIIKGSELDEPEEKEVTINVIKVDGRWIIDYISLAGDLVKMGMSAAIGSAVAGGISIG